MATNEKRVLSFEIDDDVKKVTITGEDKDQQVVMRQELSEDDLDAVAGGVGGSRNPFLDKAKKQGQRPTQLNPDGIVGSIIVG